MSEVKRGMSNVSVEGKIIEKSVAKKVRTRYETRSVADATLKDETATIGRTCLRDVLNDG